MRLGICIDGMSPSDHIVRFCLEAERAGFHSIWAADHLCHRDSVALAAAILSNTRRIKVSPLALSPYARHPMTMAMAVATLDELAPGRVSLAIGAGQGFALNEIGLNTERPLRAIEESVAVVRGLLKGEFFNYQGEAFKVLGAKMGFEPGRDIQLYIAAIGPKMLGLAGRIADGAILSAGLSKEYIRFASDLLAQGAPLASGRDGRAELACIVAASVSDDGRKAVDAAKLILAYILVGEHHMKNLELTGTKIDRIAILKALKARDWEEARRLISDDVVEAHCAAGTLEACSAKLEALERAGLDEAVLLLVGSQEDKLKGLELASAAKRA